MNELFDNVHNINIEDLFFLWEAKIGILSREEIICFAVRTRPEPV